MTRKDRRHEAGLSAGTRDHYLDAILYDHEYKRRRDDVRHYRELAKKIGGPILDLGCGTGRILLALMRDGHEVVGVDASEAMLARLRAKNPKADVRYGDIREISLRRKFPLVLCAFNTLMHLYDRSELEACLNVVRRHLRPGGVFAFDVMNPSLRWLSRDPNRRWSHTKFKDPQTGEPMIYSMSLGWDGPNQIAWMKIYYAPVDNSRPEKIVHLTQRHYFPQELKEIFFYNGFVMERHEGDFEGGDLRTGSEQQVCICRLKSPSRK